MSNINLEFNEITKFRLDEIKKVKEYFNNEIKERKDIINKINKYIVAFDYYRYSCWNRRSFANFDIYRDYWCS